MQRAFLSYIKKENLFNSSDKILLTVSGGIDSLAMVELFHHAGFNFGIAHCNFQLRGEESDGDEIFVRSIAEKYSLKFHLIKFDTAIYAKKNKVSIQIAARELRYQWFEEIRASNNYSFIATAHHKDDSIETFFINLIRGSGISGLHGILSKNANVIRPLLFTNKNDITKYVKSCKIYYRDDSSNASEKYIRNKIRLKLIPLLKELNPNINQTIAEDIKRLANTEKIYRKEIFNKSLIVVEKHNNSISFSIKELKKLDPIESYLFEFLQPFGFNFAVVNEIVASLDGLSGKKFLSATHRLVKDREYLLIDKIPAALPKVSQAMLTPQIANFQIDEENNIIENMGLKFVINKLLKPSVFSFPASNKIASFDYNKLNFPLELRKWQKGDVFQPIGMKGKKLISDFFIDEKFSIQQKENAWLLTSRGKIIWLVGHRMDDKFKVTDKTIKIYIVELL